MQDTELSPGSMFGAYEIVRALGCGAFGTVYEALKRPLGKRVALKVMHASMTLHPEAVARFVREAEAAARLSHPAIVDVQDVGEVGGVPFLSMEYLDGETLAARVHRLGRIEVSEATDLILPILSALQLVHAAGIIHRDLKPENIFIVRGITGEHAKILDFGIAKVRQYGVSLTQTSTMLGTPVYMSPEQVRDAKHIDGRSDLWAVGVVLYECVAGRPPFDGESTFDVMEQIVRASIAPPRSLNPAIDPGFERVLGRALQRDPAARFSSAQEFSSALVPFASPRMKVNLGVREPSTEIHAPAGRPGEATTLPTTVLASAPGSPPALEASKRTGGRSSLLIVLSLVIGSGVVVSVGWNRSRQRDLAGRGHDLRVSTGVVRAMDGDRRVVAPLTASPMLTAPPDGAVETTVVAASPPSPARVTVLPQRRRAAPARVSRVPRSHEPFVTPPVPVLPRAAQPAPTLPPARAAPGRPTIDNL